MKARSFDEGAMIARRSCVALLALGCLTAAACGRSRDEAASTTGCAVRVIVALQAAPDAALVADLARVSGSRLDFVRTMTTNLHLFSLETAGADSECDAAVERLRRDARVRAVDLDERREIGRP